MDSNRHQINISRFTFFAEVEEDRRHHQIMPWILFLPSNGILVTVSAPAVLASDGILRQKHKSAIVSLW